MKSREEQLRSLRKANKAYKLKLAQKAGYITIEDYQKFLVKVSVPLVKRPSKIKPTIHICEILDSSGSMNGGKYNNSCEGIRSGIGDLRENKNVNYTYTFIEFIDSNKILTHNFLSEVPTNVYFNGATGNNTPLYHVVRTTLERLEKAVGKDSKVLVKVFTDGESNALEGPAPASKLIKKLQEENFTITFVATDRDLAKITRDLNLDESNTLAVQDSAEGFRKAFKMSNEATVMYTASVSRGEDVSKGFYKKVGKL